MAAPPPAPDDLAARIDAWLYRHTGISEDRIDAVRADLLAAVPELADAAANAAAVTRVRALAEYAASAARHAHCDPDRRRLNYLTKWLRRALDGEATP